ncbi:SAM-dependent methyltransferase [Anaerocolumna cellulosilytica]|uniref:SAM-dependent methyltransferase n=1 Tax=Anaerocolumna cellulosilytica TaxID=433286 RepID=A0A6S6QUZ6_9FIRM|nr:class I SAM-dependent methyltransferase [Anaerocolumna cellulosilytica]MBB5196434.1 ubiquinone/menaquinone biosynthesis C-methylase UbiE [Anaerocolumna cellulosilytica]BCJ94444.1 SAM-dependent methyltransferase [Anaerocolumna cellulosilytica]
MENRLQIIAESYNRSIEFGRQGINLYEKLPDYIINDPDFPAYQKLNLSGELSGSEIKEIYNYLLPNKNMKFIDLGCCLNLRFKGYDKWPSTYYGIDISSKTIELLTEFATANNLQIGSLHCGSIHKMPFKDNMFDIGACIGVLEYFEKDYVAKAIVEAHRVIKPYGKFVLDIPNLGTPVCRIMMLIEEHMGRTDKFNMSPQEFEELIQGYFEIEKAIEVDSGGMIEYYLRCKK